MNGAASEQDKVPLNAARKPGEASAPLQERDIAARRALTWVGIAALTGVLLFVAWQVAEALLLVFAGVLLAVFLRSLADAVAGRTPLSAGWALGLVGLALVGGIAAGVWLLGPRVAAEADQLGERVPSSIRQLEQLIREYEWGRQILAEVPGVGDLAGGGDLLSRVTGIFSTTLNWITTIIFVLFIGIFLAAEPGHYTGGIVRLVPMRGRERAGEVLSALGQMLRSWLKGQGLAMVIVGVLTAAGLWLLGVPLALTLGVIAGLLEFMPTIGPPIAMALAFLVALTVSPTLALYVVLLSLAIQFVESNIIAPMIHKHVVNVPPALTLTSQVVAGILFGFLGLLLAVPLAAVTLEAVKMLYVEDVLGDTEDKDAMYRTEEARAREGTYGKERTGRRPGGEGMGAHRSPWFK